MTLPSSPQNPKPAPRRRAWWRRRWVWVLGVMLAVAGWGAWREYDFRRAVREAEAMGFHFETSESPFDAIRANWRAAFRRATWTQRWPVLQLPKDSDLTPLRPLLQRLRLAGLHADGSRNVAALQRLTGLRELGLDHSDVKDLTPLSGLAQLQWLSLDGSTGVADLAPLASLAQLQLLSLNGCTGVTDLTPLAGLAQLQALDLNGCTGVTDLTPLAGLAQLQDLYLEGCTGVTDLTPLAGLPQLQRLLLIRCTGLSAEGVAAFRESHPKVLVIGP